MKKPKIPALKKGYKNLKIKKISVITVIFLVISAMSYKAYCNYQSYPKPRINIATMEEEEKDELDIFFMYPPNEKSDYCKWEGTICPKAFCSTSYELPGCKETRIWRKRKPKH